MTRLDDLMLLTGYRAQVAALTAERDVADAVRRRYEAALEAIALPGDHSLAATIARQVLTEMRMDDD